MKLERQSIFSFLQRKMNISKLKNVESWNLIRKNELWEVEKIGESISINKLKMYKNISI